MKETEEGSPKKKMGRPLNPNKLTAAERKRLSRQRAGVREREYEREKENKLEGTEEGRELLRSKWQRQKKQQRENQSAQKHYGLKQKDRAKKRKEKKSNEPVKEPVSTERTRRHRSSLKVKYDFKKKTQLLTPLRKSKERLQGTLKSLPREEKVNFLRSVVDSQSPGCKWDLAGPSTQSPPTPLTPTYTLLKKKRDPVSNCVKRVLLATLDDKCSKKGQKAWGIVHNL